MLQNFLICVNAVVPSAIYLAIGIILKLAHVVTDEEVRKFTHMVFVALYPFIMFENLYGKNIAEHNVLGKRIKLSVGTLIPLLVCPHLLCNISVLNSCRDSHNAHSFLRLWKTAANSAMIMNRIPTFAEEKGSPVLGIPFSFLRSMRP